ncbi:MAG: urease accessory protein UreD [Gammaproteobacteria bacterium]|nr:urease accessory protein UreD [Gammaproteobacteria bacterium]
MSKLALQFANDIEGKTYLQNQYASYPFHICRTQYYENDPYGMASVYIQSASGGIYENENLSTDVIARAKSNSHVTTQASTIVHSMPNGMAHQNININASDYAYTEYVSDPLILFPDSSLRSNINVHIDRTSTVVVADAFLLHFLNDEEDLFRQYESSLCIYSEDNELLTKDVYLANPGNFAHNHRKHISMGTISVIDRNIIDNSLLTSLQILMQNSNDIYGGATLLPNNCGIIIKYLAPDGVALKKTMIQSWMIIRETLVNIKPKIRRK